jgi:acyl-CoA hydrolase
MPYTFGDAEVPVDVVDLALEVDEPLRTGGGAEADDAARTIGERISAMVPDGATLQLGIGAIPDAVLSCLTNHEDLGIHTEMFSDGLLALAERGVITNRYKATWRGRVVTSFALGSQELYNFIDGNPFVEFHSSDIVNDTREIRRNPNVVAINSALEIDLTGQVVADSIGEYIYSGIGGQMDFVRGARLSPGGKAVISLPSTAKGGAISRIVPTIKPGSGVVTTRGHVEYVATEYGVVDLAGQSLRRRAELLISIAHPDTRADLRAAAQNRNYFIPAHA